MKSPEPNRTPVQYSRPASSGHHVVKVKAVPVLQSGTAFRLFFDYLLKLFLGYLLHIGFEIVLSPDDVLLDVFQ